MIWGGSWEGGSGLGTHELPWLIHVNVWQIQYSIVKQNKIKTKFFFNLKKKLKKMYRYRYRYINRWVIEMERTDAYGNLWRRKWDPVGS